MLSCCTHIISGSDQPCYLVHTQDHRIEPAVPPLLHTPHHRLKVTTLSCCISTQTDEPILPHAGPVQLQSSNSVLLVCEADDLSMICSDVNLPDSVAHDGRIQAAQQAQLESKDHPPRSALDKHLS